MSSAITLGHIVRQMIDLQDKLDKISDNSESNQILDMINDRITHASINQKNETVTALRELREAIWAMQGKSASIDKDRQLEAAKELAFNFFMGAKL